MKENLIITGGLGFIGSNLIKLLLKKNFSVINIDNVSYSSNFYNLRNLMISTFRKYLELCVITFLKIVYNEEI